MHFRSFLPLALALKVSSSFASDTQLFTPLRLSHESLASVSFDIHLLDALTTDGIVSITNIPGFNDVKRNLMTHLHSCMLDMENNENVFKSSYNDGTIRRTMSSVTIPGPGGARPFDYDAKSLNCQAFSEDLGSFRKMVDSTTDLFASRVSMDMGTALKVPLMDTEDGEYSFDDFKDVVREGEHLEHFHSYQKLTAASSESKSENTIELHTDQGLFIAFTPGLMVSHDASSGAPDMDTPLKESEGFYIETADGNTALVNLSSEDELVFMMGDGVNQYVNPMLREDSVSQSKKLRATPHAVALPAHDASMARVWYGLMVLPPADAYSEKDQKTYGDVRRMLSTLSSMNKEDVPAGLGCSVDTMRALDSAGQSDSGCEEGHFQCWFRCMSLADHAVSHETCIEANHSIKCANPRDQITDGFKHGDYFPACTDSVEEATPYPNLPNFPQDIEVCTQEKFDEFNTVGEEFEHMFNLTTHLTNAYFYWTPNKEAGTIKARLSFNGLFGFIAFGFANLDPDAGHNGMNGGTVVLATPGSSLSYSAVTGLDLTSDPTVAEYVISHEGSAFRLWQEPVGETSAEVFTDNCFTSLEFEMDGIFESKFNLEGSNVMLWAANTEDYFVGYHSRNRAIFTVDWSNGKAEFGKVLTSDSVEEESEEVETNGSEEVETNGSEEVETNGSEELETNGSEELETNGSEEVETNGSEAEVEADVIVPEEKAESSGVGSGHMKLSVMSSIVFGLMMALML